MRGHREIQGTHSASRLRRVVASAIVLLLSVLGALVTAPAASAAEEGTIHSLVNHSRAAAGLGGLTLNGALSQVALAWANQMAAAGVLSHNPSYSTQIPGGWGLCGENVAQGYPNASSVHQGWMNSSGHRANVLGDYTDIGIAHIAAGGTTWSVEVFAKYGASAPAPVAAAPAPAPAPVSSGRAPAGAPGPAAAAAEAAAAQAAAELAAAEAAAAEAAAIEAAAAAKAAAYDDVSGGPRPPLAAQGSDADAFVAERSGDSGVAGDDTVAGDSEASEDGANRAVTSASGDAVAVGSTPWAVPVSLAVAALLALAGGAIFLGRHRAATRAK